MHRAVGDVGWLEIFALLRILEASAFVPRRSDRLLIGVECSIVNSRSKVRGSRIDMR